MGGFGPLPLLMIVRKSIIEGPNGELIFDIVEDVTDLARTNAEIREKVDGWSEDRSRRMNVSVPPRVYYYWASKLGEECWFDANFIRSFMKEYPQYATCDYRRV